MVAFNNKTLVAIASKLILTAIAARCATAFVVLPNRAFVTPTTKSPSFRRSLSPTSDKISTRLSLPSTRAVLKDLLDLEVRNEKKDLSDDLSDDEKVWEVIDLTIKILRQLSEVDSVGELAKVLVGLDISLISEATDAKGKVEKNHPFIIKTIELLEAFQKLKNKVSPMSMGYGTYPNHPEFPNYNLSTMMKKMEGNDPPPLEYFFSPKKVVQLIGRVVESVIGEGLRKDDVEKAPNTEAKYEEMFTKSKILGIPNPLNFRPKPNSFNYWEDDKYIARQFLCGVNPVMIRVAKSKGEISDDLVNYFGSGFLQDLIKEKRLFYVSYDDLLELNVNPHQAYPLPMNANATQDQPRYFYAPIALFLLDISRNELDILGIQLERNINSRVYTKGNSGEDEWLFIKSCLTTADTQFHEWVSHLGRTHLSVEPHIIAIHNTLRQTKHPIYTFVKPLCPDTLLLNWAARNSLASYKANSTGDYICSVGCGQFMQLIQKMWSRYSFFEQSALPLELASRGFDEDFEMPAYLYREDGLKLWNAYGGFAADFVSEVYASDADVSSDKKLQEWAKETASPDHASVPGFPKSFQAKATLVKVLQTLMWMTSGLHAAVNFPQYEYYAYAPNKPFNQRAELPKSSVTRESIFDNAFPLTSLEEGTVIPIAILLTAPSHHCIDELEENFSTVGKKSYAKFQVKLKEIQDEIEKRNKAAAKNKQPVYDYLNPCVVPASIDI